jgi:hypothetical protein
MADTARSGGLLAILEQGSGGGQQAERTLESALQRRRRRAKVLPMKGKVSSAVRSRSHITPEWGDMELDSKLTKEVRLSFRDQLREARFKAQKDAEAFEEIVFVLERLGTLLSPGSIGLARKLPSIVVIASDSPLFYSGVPDASHEMLAPFERLCDQVRQARNDAMHEGFAARHATARAIELSIILENALMNGFDKVSDFMVRNPTCAAIWQPVSFIRQTMLATSFSCLPVNTAPPDSKPQWKLVSDKAIARYLGLRPNGVELKDRLFKPLGKAIDDGDDGLNLINASNNLTCREEDPVSKILQTWRDEGGLAFLVVRGDSDELVGIVTPYDLL